MAHDTSVDITFIQNLLLAGVYPENTLNQYNIFGYEQPKPRRRYPSAEIVYIPESLSENKKETDKTLGFEIRYYDKIVGGRDTQLTNLKTVEDQIIALIDAGVLEDPNILLQTLQWTREHIQRDREHPEYNVSTLKVFVKTRIEAGQVNDAILIFKKASSTVTSPPASDYTYSQVYDTEIMEGYRTHEEQVTISPVSPGVPIRYRGGYFSRFITHIHIKTTDLGSTGDKVNQLNALLSGGEKPLISLSFTANSVDSPVKHTISESIVVDIDRVEKAYQYQDITIYRVYGFLTQPSTITTS